MWTEIRNTSTRGPSFQVYTWPQKTLQEGRTECLLFGGPNVDLDPVTPPRLSHALGNLEPRVYRRSVPLNPADE